MRSAQAAEWILSLFLESDRAAAYTGDLMEEVDEHGVAWFWLSVARLAIMRFWYDVADSPFFLAGVLVRAFILNIAANAALIFGFAILCGFLFLPFALLAGWLHPAPWGIPGREELGRWAGSLFAIAIAALCAFLTGRWIARRMPNREIAACLAMCVAQPLFYGLIGFVIKQVWERVFSTMSWLTQTWTGARTSRIA
jgi:hypothetical protein